MKNPYKTLTKERTHFLVVMNILNGLGIVKFVGKSRYYIGQFDIARTKLAEKIRCSQLNRKEEYKVVLVKRLIR